MISGEWRAIRHSKILWISVSVMILIPFLYSVFFLTSVWDPYGDTKHLPVAVVNNDRPITYQGKRFAVGEQLITNLKKNHQLGWHFVSADKAEQGMANHKYYTVVTIPSNFSKHATTVTSKHPQRMKLHYSTNASLNYIAKVISDAGATQLNQNVRAAVTKAYAVTMFKQVKTAGEGFSKAAKGARQLKDGTVVLQSGLKTYTTGVHTLDNGVTELNTQVKQMPAGMQKLVAGSSALKTGLDTLNGSTGELASGVNKLANGSGQVTSGLNTLNGKTGQLASGVSKLAAGSNQVTAGLGTLNSSTGKLSNGVVQLADGSKALKVGVVTYTDGVYTLSTGIRTLNSKTGELSSGVSALETGSKTLTDKLGEYTAGVDSANDGAKTVSDGLATLKDSTQTLGTNARALSDGATTLSNGLSAATPISQQVAAGTAKLASEFPAAQEGIAGLDTNMKQLIKLLSETPTAKTDSSNVQKITSDMQEKTAQLAKSSGTTIKTTTTGTSDATINSKIDAVAAKDKLTTDQVNDLKTALKGSGQSDSTTTNQGADNSDTIKALQADVAAVKQAAVPAATQATSSEQILALANGISHGLTQMNEQIGKIDTATLNAGATGVAKGLTQMQPGSQQLADGLKELNAQAPDMVSGIAKLADGSTELSAGTSKLSSNSAALNAGASQLSTGLTTLNGQVPTLVKGVSDLNNGGKQLTANSAALVSGSKQLATGTAQLKQQVPTLVSGVAQLFNGSKQVSGGLTTLNGQVPALTSGVQQLANGSSQVTTGLVTLNGKVPTLVTGVQKLDSGAGQLNGGLQTLNGSTGKLVSGVQQLADGADQLDDNSPKLLSGTKKLKNGNGTLAKSLQSGADTVNATPLKNANAQMFATPSKLTHSNYSYVPNYGHALAPYVLSLALYVGAIVFNFAYPIRRMSDDDGTATEWFLSKLAVGVPVAILMAIIECIALLIVGLKPISMAGYFTTAVMIALASMFIVMFLSMLLDNPGRFLAMVLLMLQLGGSGGTFPMEITNHFFNVIHPYLPLTYSILAFRESLTGGWGTGTFVSSIAMLALFAIVALILLWISMVFLKQHNMQEPAEAPIQMKAGK